MITANMFFNRLEGGWEEFRATVLVPRLGKSLIPEQGYDEESQPFKAYVNHGRWLVKCECGGCEKVWEEGWVMCQSCLNAAQGHKYRRTVFPTTRKKIEEILIVRPLPNRNWSPGETLADLRRENEEHKEELL